MPSGDDDLDDLDPSGSQAEVDDDETPATVQGYLRAGEEYLGQIIESRGKGRDGDALSGLRHAVKKTARLVEEAEKRGYQKARSEVRVEALDDATREQLRREFVEELRGQDATRRNALRLGVPEALLGNFEGLGPDFKEWERRADELRSQGIQWGGDPLLRELAQQRTAAWETAAQQAADSDTVAAGDQPGVPPEIAARITAEAVGKMQATQAGGAAPFTPDLGEEIQKAARNPGAYSREDLEALAAKFNTSLDGLAQQIGGRF